VEEYLLRERSKGIGASCEVHNHHDKKREDPVTKGKETKVYLKAVGGTHRVPSKSGVERKTRRHWHLKRSPTDSSNKVGRKRKERISDMGSR